MNPQISIIILTYNGAGTIDACLEAVFKQPAQLDYEVILIDSHSTDKTLEIARKYPVQIVQIAAEEFSHSRTRNLGVGQARGEYLVFLTQDATPVNNNWLESLIRPFKKDPAIAGIYSRQIPREDCCSSEARDICAGSGIAPKLKTAHDLGGPKKELSRNLWRAITFSNISAAYPKVLLEKNPFNEQLPAAEDQEWALRMLKKGFSIFYQPDSCVYHSHEYSLKQLFKRYRMFGSAFKKFIPERTRSTFYYFLKVCAYETAKDYSFLLTYRQGGLKKAAWFLKIPLYRIVKNYAFYLGFKNG